MDAPEQLSLPTGVPDMHPLVPRDLIELVIRDVARANGLGRYADDLVEMCGLLSRFDVAYGGPVQFDRYGLFQLSPAMAKFAGVNRLDWRDNIVGGVKCMAYLMGRVSYQGARRLYHEDQCYA